MKVILFWVFCASTNPPSKGAPSGPFTVPATVAAEANGEERMRTERASYLSICGQWNISICHPSGPFAYGSRARIELGIHRTLPEIAAPFKAAESIDLSFGGLYPQPSSWT